MGTSPHIILELFKQIKEIQALIGTLQRGLLTCTLFQSLAAQSERTWQCLLQKAHTYCVKEREINAGPWRQQVTELSELQEDSADHSVTSQERAGTRTLGKPRQFESHPVRCPNELLLTQKDKAL